MGLGRARGSEWQRQPTELISWSLLLSPKLWGGPTAECHICSLLCSPKPSLHSYWGWTKPLPLTHSSLASNPPRPKSYFPVKSSEVVCFIFWGSILLLKEHGDPSSGPWPSTKALRLGQIAELHASVSSSTKQRTRTSSLGSVAALPVHGLVCRSTVPGTEGALNICCLKR